MSQAVYRPQDVGIILSYRCGSRCQHCLYNCGPEWGGEAMAVRDLQQALEQLAGWPQPPQVHLTGGEPFFVFDLLLEGTRMAAELDMAVYTETSAAWCTDEDLAIERFYALRQAGLAAVLISCSPFHAERIPPERTLRAVQAALTIFGASRVLVYLPPFLEIVQQFGVREPTPLERYEERLGRKKLGRLLWQEYGLIAGGRAGYKLGHLIETRPAEAFAGECCAADILLAGHSHMDLYGNYIPGFCGGLALADWRSTDPFGEERPELIELLIEGGPHGLYELARKRYGYRPLPAGYAGKCHLCVDVRWHLVREAAGEYPELRPLQFYSNI